MYYRNMKCSLIICTYNWPEALRLVLGSVISQSIKPDEIIIADDGSNEDTESLINEFSKTTSIPVIHSWQEDQGCRIPHSRNLAISKSNFVKVKLAISLEIKPLDSISAKSRALFKIRFEIRGVPLERFAISKAAELSILIFNIFADLLIISNKSS